MVGAINTLGAEPSFDLVVDLEDGGVIEGAGAVCFFLRPRFGDGVNGVGYLLALTSVVADSAAAAINRVERAGTAGMESDGDGVVVFPPALNLPVKPV